VHRSKVSTVELVSTRIDTRNLIDPTFLYMVSQIKTPVPYATSAICLDTYLLSES